jgi:hypothetical protein
MQGRPWIYIGNGRDAKPPAADMVLVRNPCVPNGPPRRLELWHCLSIPTSPVKRKQFSLSLKVDAQKINSVKLVGR